MAKILYTLADCIDLKRRSTATPFFTIISTFQRLTKIVTIFSQLKASKQRNNRVTPCNFCVCLEDINFN